MKSVKLKEGGLDNLVIEEMPEQKPERNQVKVRWHATSLNYHDYLIAKGGIPVKNGRIPMSDGAGEVIELGEDVQEWQIGDKVMSMFFPGWNEGDPAFKKLAAISGETVDGCMTEESCVYQNSLTAMPDNYSYAQAACLPCAALTAWHAFFEIGRLNPGEKVLIEGTGGMSIFALQFATSAGAEVYATSGSEDKYGKLQELGVKEVLNYKSDPGWGKSIFKLSEGGMDHIIDVGGGSTMKQTIEASRIGGKIYSIGILGNGRKGEITFPKLFFKFIKLYGLAVGSRVMQERMLKAINQNGLKPIIDKSFAFDQLADAFQYQESGKHFGKIVLEW